MQISYDVFAEAFLAKVSEYEFMSLPEENRSNIVDGYMKRAIASFMRICKHDFVTTGDDSERVFDIDSITPAEVVEIADIVSDGMVVQWMKPYLNRQDLLENALNTRDFTTYSPAALLKSVGDAYAKAQADYLQAVREYSFNTGNLGSLHL